jgi:hypothetical protein
MCVAGTGEGSRGQTTEGNPGESNGISVAVEMITGLQRLWLHHQQQKVSVCSVCFSRATRPMQGSSSSFFTLCGFLNVFLVL